MLRYSCCFLYKTAVFIFQSQPWGGVLTALVKSQLYGVSEYWQHQSLDRVWCAVLDFHSHCQFTLISFNKIVILNQFPTLPPSPKINEISSFGVYPLFITQLLVQAGTFLQISSLLCHPHFSQTQ